MNYPTDKISGIVVIVVIIMAVLVIGSRFLPSSTPEEKVLELDPTHATPRTYQTLVSDRATGDKLSVAFTVPEGCPAQVLEYSGRVDDARLDVAWVHFVAVTEPDGDWAASSGPNNLRLRHEDTETWNLPPGSYEIETTAGNAEWQYSLKCD